MVFEVGTRVTLTRRMQLEVGAGGLVKLELAPDYTGEVTSVRFPSSSNPEHVVAMSITPGCRVHVAIPGDALRAFGVEPLAADSAA